MVNWMKAAAEGAEGSGCIMVFAGLCHDCMGLCGLERNIRLKAV